ncbi:putative NH(3)-dependent NAD(+) synthetase [uncultured archaeon]|nr:putative NH(3)-dependent NAD(+) synthetase [uncultured archaeon]
MDSSKTEKKLVSGIKKFFIKQGKSKAVLGLSGGVDSALVLSLLVKALGERNVTAIMMPNTAVTSEKSTEDARKLAEARGVAYFVVPIDNMLAQLGELPWKQSDIAKANLGPRARAVVLYNYANSNDCLVAGTGNKSEYYMGYFTKHGDAAADFFPIGGLLKKDVMALAKHMGVPRAIIEKAPSAELWLGQEDEKELGLKYEDLDELLPLLLSRKKIPEGKKEVAEKILVQMKATGHKRKQAEIILP